MNKVRLGDICRITMGQSPDSSTYNDDGIGVPFYQGNADFGKLHPTAVHWCTEPKKTAEKGDILISVRAPIGALNIANEHCCIGRGLASITVNEDVAERDYIWYLLKSKDSYLQSKGTGSTFKAINKNVLFELPVDLPSKNEQKSISDLLSKSFELATRYNIQLIKLDELIKSRFVEMFGDPVHNRMNWNTKPLAEMCKVIVDCPHSTPNYTSSNTGYMCIRTSIVKKNRIMWDKIEYISKDEYYQRIQRKKPEKGDIIYTREGAILGIAAIIDRDCSVALGQRSMLLSPDRSLCTPEFLSVAMNFETFLNQALNGISGSASPHINVGDVKLFQMIQPPINKQQEYSTFVTRIEQQKATVQQSIDKLETLKKSLMQEYFG